MSHATFGAALSTLRYIKALGPDPALMHPDTFRALAAADDRVEVTPFAVCVQCGRDIATADDWGKHGSADEYYCRACVREQGARPAPRGTNRTPPKRRRKRR